MKTDFRKLYFQGRARQERKITHFQFFLQTNLSKTKLFDT